MYWVSYFRHMGMEHRMRTRRVCLVFRIPRIQCRAIALHFIPGNILQTLYFVKITFCNSLTHVLQLCCSTFLQFF